MALGRSDEGVGHTFRYRFATNINELTTSTYPELIPGNIKDPDNIIASIDTDIDGLLEKDFLAYDDPSRLSFVGKRWSLLILKSLDSKESIRFNGLKRTLSGISSTVLADRLLELEREGLIVKKIYPEMPPRVEYSLTYRAKELGVILRSLGDWVKKWNSKLKTTGIYQIETNINTNINRQVSR